MNHVAAELHGSTNPALPSALSHGTPIAQAGASVSTVRAAMNLRSAEEIAAIERSGVVVAAALEAAEAAVVAGVSTAELDALVRATIVAHGAEPSFLGYPHAAGGPAFPASSCISVNNEVVHGIPGVRVLNAGDVVKIDVGARFAGWCADAAVTVRVPANTNHALDAHAADAMVISNATIDAFIADAWQTLHVGIAAMQPGVRWSEVAGRMQRFAVARGHGMVDGWHGHGVGRSVHEAPQAPSTVSAGLREYRDFTLLPGMVLAIEPIVVMGAQGVIDASGCLIPVPVSVAADRWTVAVAPGLVAAHVEHTIAVTRSGPRILTRRTGVRAGIALNDCNGGSSRLLG